MKKNTCRMMAVVMCMLMLIVFCAPSAYAANAGSSIKGSCAQTVTFMVKTKGTTLSAKPNIKLTQTKGVMKAFTVKLTRNEDIERTMYEYYEITLYKLKNGKYVQQGKVITWSDGSETIKLDKNSTYKIKVVPYGVKYKDDFGKWGPLLSPYPNSILNNWAPVKWIKNSTWKISSTARVSSCSMIYDYYTYNVEYVSSNGTPLGSTTVKQKAGTTNTITPPAISGYNTPAAQKVTWDTSKKTIRFVYTPAGTASSTSFSGTWWAYKGKAVLSYKAVVETRNRTANSIEYRVIWTNSCAKDKYYGFTQKFEVKCGSATTGKVKICGYDTMGYKTMGKVRTATASSGWIKVTGLSPSTTALTMNCYGYSDDNISFSKVIPIPSY